MTANRTSNIHASPMYYIALRGHLLAGVGAADYARRLSSLEPGSSLSLYLHLPFCDSLCWFCACTTKFVRRYEPVAHYLQSLHKEIGLISRLVPAAYSVSNIHWGGGSPDILAPADILQLAQQLRDRFNVEELAEFAVEVDPRGLTPGKVAYELALHARRALIWRKDGHRKPRKIAARPMKARASLQGEGQWLATA